MVVVAALAILLAVAPLKYILLAAALVVAAMLVLPKSRHDAATSAASSATQDAQQQAGSRAATQPKFDTPAAAPAPAEATLSAADGIAREERPAEGDAAAFTAANGTDGPQSTTPTLPPPNGKSGPVVGGAAILARLRCVVRPHGSTCCLSCMFAVLLHDKTLSKKLQDLPLLAAAQVDNLPKLSTRKSSKPYCRFVIRMIYRNPAGHRGTRRRRTRRRRRPPPQPLRRRWCCSPRRPAPHRR